MFQRGEFMNTDEPEPLLLIVEDSEDDAFFLERTLRRTELPCRRCYVSDGAQAVAFLQAQNQSAPADRPAVIFLDLKMPVLSGFDVLRWVQKDGGAGPWDIVILSGSNQQSDVDAARRLGASGYLVKPARVEELKACLIPRIQCWKQRLAAFSDRPVEGALCQDYHGIRTSA